MDLIAFWAGIIGLPSIILLVIKHYLERAEKRSKENAAARKQEIIMMMKSISANGALAEATALAIQRGKTNGEMQAAMDYYMKVKHELKDYLMEQNADNLYGD